MNPAESTFLVVGCGSIGQRHLRNLSDLGVGTLMGVDPAPETRATVREAFDVPVESSLSDAVEKNPDVAVVSVPNHLHVEVALEAARAGCHLFVEKPLSHTAEGVAELRRAIARRDLTTMVACNMRFHPCIREVKRLVSEGTVGDPVAVRAEAGQYLPDWHPEEDYRDMYSAKRDEGGGAILDYIHELDYVRWLLGRIDTVSCIAESSSHLDIETEDTAGILLRFADGIVGEVHVDYLQREYSRSCHVVGETGTIRWDWQSGTVTWYEAETESHGEFSLDEDWGPNEMYVDEMRHFMSVLAGEAVATKSIDDGAAILDVALAARRSARNDEHVHLNGPER